jgi:threonylcarbamoyladenosine tRNA methylthiotransferase MtaB
MFKVCFITFGCKLNQSETFSWQEKFIEKGVQIVSEQQKPDLIIINACSVTAKAERELRQKVNQLKRKFPWAKVVVTGCFLFSKKFIKIIPREKMINFISGLVKKYSNLGKNNKNLLRTRNFVKVQDGCNNFCAYCVVPFLRGRIYSRSIPEIIDEIKNREAQGYREIVLVGTDLQKFGDKKRNLVYLLKQILSQTRINRIRLSSLWPTAINKQLIDLMKNEASRSNLRGIKRNPPKPQPSLNGESESYVCLKSSQRTVDHSATEDNPRICPHLHLSMQSGSDKILTAMGRSYQLSQVLKLIRQARAIRNLSLTADLIVGFPGETDQDFAQTIQFVKKSGLLKAHIFKYSPRPGTRAAKMPNQVSEAIKKARSRELRRIAELTAEETKKKYLGKSEQVLFEAKRGDYWAGFTDNYLRVYASSRGQIANQLIRVKLISIFRDGYRGQIVK